MAAGAAFFLLVAACAPPPRTVATIESPSTSPSPAPTPTTMLAATAPSFHSGEVGLAYSAVSFSATGGVAPYKWSVASGALPGGLTLGSDGSVSGTPTSGGTSTFTIAVSDSGDSTAKADGKISVADALTAHLRPECSSYCNVELGCVTACGNFGSLTGGVGPYDFKVVGGTVPSGTSVVGFSLSGTFGGQTGWVQFTVQASDSLGATTTVSPKFWMYPHLSFGGGTIPSNPQIPCWWTGAGPNAPGCTATFPYSGGTPNSGAVTATASWANYACSSPGGPPAVPAVSAANGLVTVSVPHGGGPGGCPSSDGYKGTLTIVLTNQDLCSGSTVKCSASGAVAITQLSG